MFSEDKIDQIEQEKLALKEQWEKQSENLRRQYSMVISDNEKENRELLAKIETLEIQNLEYYQSLKVIYYLSSQFLMTNFHLETRIWREWGKIRIRIKRGR